MLAGFFFTSDIIAKNSDFIIFNLLILDRLIPPNGTKVRILLKENWLNLFIPKNDI